MGTGENVGEGVCVGGVAVICTPLVSASSKHSYTPCVINCLGNSKMNLGDFTSCFVDH